MMKIRYTLFMLFICFLGVSQETRLSIDWKDVIKDTEAPLNSASQLSQDDSGRWFYTEQWKVDQPVLAGSVQLENVVYEAIPASQLSSITKNKVASELSYELQSGQARDQFYAILRVTPFVVVNGQYMRVTSAEVSYAFAKAYCSCF